MKFTYRRRPVDRKRSLILGASIALILIGVGIFTYNIYHFSNGYFAYKPISAGDANSNTKVLTENKAGHSQASVKDSNTDMDQIEQDLYPIRPEIGDEIGELTIPKLDATLPIFHGTREDELEKGVGHYAGSVLPGEADNCVLSGHRDTVFRNLGKVGEGDELIVKTSAGEFLYKVSKVRIVDADDRTVIVPKPRATLTVSTCYPFRYVGSAPQRYILVAYLAEGTYN